MKTILETIFQYANLKTFGKALEETNLSHRLQGETFFTVFAPNDNAFAKIPQSSLFEILKQKEKLANIIAYHLVLGKFKLKDLEKIDFLETLEGGKIKIKKDNNLLFNQSKISDPDIECSNGIIHIICQVLFPNEKYF